MKDSSQRIPVHVIELATKSERLAEHLSLKYVALARCNVALNELLPIDIQRGANVQDIIEGFLRFQCDVFPTRSGLLKRLASSQNPCALFISCSDSRLVPELVTQREPGDLFVIRNAGNIVPPFGPEPGGVTASVEYAVAALQVTDIVICGHSDCGAMTAIATCKCLDHMPAVANWGARQTLYAVDLGHFPARELPSSSRTIG